MSGAIPPLPQYAFMAWCLVKHRNSFTFTLPLPYLLSEGKKNQISLFDNRNDALPWKYRLTEGLFVRYNGNINAEWGVFLC
jgi:hypothetical protein